MPPQPLDAPPMLPSEVSSQLGAAPFAGVTANLSDRLGAPPPAGGVNPTGSVEAMSDAVKTIVERMASMTPAFAPFGNRIKTILDLGMSEVKSQGAPGMGPQPAAGPPPGVGGAAMREGPPPGANVPA